MQVCHLEQVDCKEHQAESPLWYLQKICSGELWLHGTQGCTLGDPAMLAYMQHRVKQVSPINYGL